MSRRRYLSLFILGLAVVLVAAYFQSTPGYMDADYYLLGGLQLVEGKGFTESVLWNYLDDPAGLPHPSNAYWMPLASILAAIGIWLTPFEGFTGGRIVFLLLAGIIPPMTAWLSWGLLSEQRDRARDRMAMLAGVLAAFSGYYLSFLTVTDTFGIYMVLGTLFLMIVSSDRDANGQAWRKWLGLGITAGFMHLARADEILWLGIAFLLGFLTRKTDEALSTKFLTRCAWSVLGYFLIMGPWFLRNWFVFGTPLAPGGTRALWVLTYDELFSFPGSVLTFERWWNAGLGEILSSRMGSLGLNLQSTLGVQGQVFLLPLILIGLWKLREKQAVKLGILAWGGTLAIMTLVFPFSGARGGFFHSGAAVQPLFWAVVPVGLEAFVAWGGRVRKWRVTEAQKVFGAGLVGLAIFLTATILFIRVSPKENGPDYREIEQKLMELGAETNPGDVVMVNNPPGYFLTTGRPAIVIPNGDVQSLRTAAEQFGAKYVVLDENIPVGLKPLLENQFTTSLADGAGLKLLDQIGDFRIFQVIEAGER